MKTFIINLERENIKYEHITKECFKLKLDFEVIPAIDGANLSEQFIRENVYDYPNCCLTKGEIGCALSHLNIYKNIIERDIPYALILEDDAILNDKLPQFINDFEKENRSQGIFMLTDFFNYVPTKKIIIGGVDLYKVTMAVRTSGYIITNKAAKKLIKFLQPIRYEADAFQIFRLCTGVKIYSAIPHLIDTNDKMQNSSSIEIERALLIKQREKYRSLLFKNDRKKRMIRLFFWRLFIRKHEKSQNISYK